VSIDRKSEGSAFGDAAFAQGCARAIHQHSTAAICGAAGRAPHRPLGNEGVRRGHVRVTCPLFTPPSSVPLGYSAAGFRRPPCLKPVGSSPVLLQVAPAAPPKADTPTRFSATSRGVYRLNGTWKFCAHPSWRAGARRGMVRFGCLSEGRANMRDMTRRQR